MPGSNPVFVPELGEYREEFRPLQMVARLVAPRAELVARLVLVVAHVVGPVGIVMLPQSAVRFGREVTDKSFGDGVRAVEVAASSVTS